MNYLLTISHPILLPGPSQLIALGGMDNLITLHAPSSLKRSPDGSAASAPSASLQAHSGFISSVTFFAGDKLFSTSGDSTAMIWDIHQQAASHMFKGSTGQGLTCGAPQPDAPAMFVTCEVREYHAIILFHGSCLNIIHSRWMVTFSFGIPELPLHR